MFVVNAYIPTRVLFGPGRLDELAECALPGKKALLCITRGGNVRRSGVLARVLELLKKNGTQAVVFDQIDPNPTKNSVMTAAALAKEEGCDFVIGLGGGSSMDAAKAVAMMMKNDGDLWDYASAGSGGRKSVCDAAPVVVISTTCGTGTETDPYSVITNEDTEEKLDFALDPIFPVLSVIDPELMLSLPRHLTVYQGFDALFHVSECYISNEHENRLLDVYSQEAVEVIRKWLPVVTENGGDLEGRTWMAYAADVLAGYTQAIVNCTSHHIIAQTIGGLFPQVAHGLSLLFVAEAYYKKVKAHRPKLLDELGGFMAITADPADPGQGFVTALTTLMEQTGVRHLAMSEYGIRLEDLPHIADLVVDNTGIEWEKYTLTKGDILDILKESYR